ncbi:hypothetical protein [Humidesulfovibrio sp.]|uniref:hypothetical protein n=1 Tax=Humidesulfovibrio sp. TaxID=2910988 RepID=UPI002D7E8344|nr:hypothetical protein [Humidesulfovibrio sp.]
MMLDYATAMETLRREGYEVRWEMVDGELLEVIPMDAVFRLCDLTGTPKAARLKAAIKKQFCGKKKR